MAWDVVRFRATCPRLIKADLVWRIRSLVTVKLLMSWDIRPGQEQTYFEFAMQTFAPALMKMGWQPTEAWYTLYGDGPQILTAGITDSLEEMRSILDSDEWEELKNRLLEYVTNFDYKVIPATGRFQL
jgi:hypothetical protein